MSVKKVKRVKKEKKNKFFDTNGDYKYIPYSLKKFCVPLDDVKLLENNPRINDNASKKLAKLIEKHGFRKPIVINEKGTVMAGNTATKAARLLGMQFIPAAPSDFGGESGERGYIVSDNKASEWAHWDEDILKELIAEETAKKKNVQSDFGLSQNDINKLFEIKKEKKLESTLEVIVSVETEKEAEKIFNEMQDRGYKCRVLAL